MVVMTPKGATWDVYDQNVADNERFMTNKKGELRPSMYEHKKFVEKDDLANINSIMVMDDQANRHNKDAVIAAFEVQDVDFGENEFGFGYSTSKAAASSVKPFSSDLNPIYDVIPVGQDQVSAIITLVSNTLDPQSFYDTLEIQTVVTQFKMSGNAMGIKEPKYEDDQWTNEEPSYVMIGISSLVQMVEDLDQEISATATKAKVVPLEPLSKIWSIIIKTAKRTINLTASYHVKHEGSNRLKHQYLTNYNVLHYKQIRTYFFMATFQVTAKAVSQRKNKYMQLFVYDTSFVFVYSMKVKTEIIYAVKAYGKEIGVPTYLILDPKGTQISKELNKVVKDICCSFKYLERRR